MTNSYVDLFLNSVFAQGDYLGALSLFFLLLGRLLPIIALAPFFGARVLPGPTKVAFAISLFVIFLPQILMNTTTNITFDTTLIFLLMKEVFIGLSIGFVINLPFVIVQTSGMIIDHQRGGASLMVNDPTIQNQSSPIGTLFNMFLIVLFYGLDGPFLVLNAIETSYEVVPIDQFLNPTFFQQDQPFWQIQIGLFNKVVIMATQLATPALLAILMTDVFLGIANRLAPQVQITFLGMPLKSLLALVVITFGWQLLAAQMAKESNWWISYLVEMIKTFNLNIPVSPGSFTS